MLRAFSGFRSGLARGSDLLKHKFYATEGEEKLNCFSRNRVKLISLYIGGGLKIL